MLKKTKVRQIIELLQKNLSDRGISGVLGVSGDSAHLQAEISEGYL